MERIHYHIDEFVWDGEKFLFVRDSEPMPKRKANREFREMVEELSKQVGRFVVSRKPDSSFPGAIRIALNHRVAIALTRCDCDGGDQ